MSRVFIFIVILLFTVQLTDAQLIGRISMDVEVGSSISVGEEKVATFQSSVNPYAVVYYSHERYKYPSFRLRTAFKQSLSSWFSAGIRTGFDLHYREYNPENHVFVCVIPLQVMAEIKTLKITKHMDAFINVAAGYELGGGWKIERSDGSFIHKKGGPVLTLEMKLGKIDKQCSFYYKFGFDYEENIWTNRYVPPPAVGSFGQEETIHTKTIKNQLFLAFGASF
jgi:hypothetical protein